MELLVVVAVVAVAWVLVKGAQTRNYGALNRVPSELDQVSGATGSTAAIAPATGSDATDYQYPGQLPSDLSSGSPFLSNLATPVSWNTDPQVSLIGIAGPDGVGSLDLAGMGIEQPLSPPRLQ
jgi:hypothetical protein